MLRVAAVAASGYVVNLVVFAACVHLIRIDYRAGSVIAFWFTSAVSVTLVSGTGLAQAIAVASALPLSFVGHKLWRCRAWGPGSSGASRLP